MSLRVNRTTRTESLKKNEHEEKAPDKTKVDIKFDNKIANDLNERIKKFNSLKTIYTNQEEYNSALKISMDNGTYNPDAPQFIYADKKFTQCLIYLEAITGDYSIVRQDGTINTEKYKEAMKVISNDMDIDATERYGAKEMEGIPKSILKLLAKPLGIKILNNKESEILRQKRIANTPPRVPTEYDMIMSSIYDS